MINWRENMYKLLIVDDEAEVREGLRTIIDWESNEITLCGEADNGVDALELIYQTSPDIVIMDIRMPVLDGLELLARISHNNISIKCIILSGYDDFYYAQKAIDLKAANYLLKPCRPNDILDAVLKAKTQLEQERQQEALFQKFEQQFLESLPTLKDKLLREIIYGKSMDYNKVESKVNLYNINLPLKNLLVALIRIDTITNLYNERGDLGVETLKIAIAQLACSSLSEHCYNEVFQNGEDIVVIISPMQQTVQMNKVLSFMELLRNSISDTLNITVTLGIGNFAENLERLWISYKEAVSAVEAKFFLGENRIIVFNDIILPNSQKTSYPLNEELAIINCLRTGNGATIEEKVQVFYKCLHQDGNPSKEYLQRATVALLGSIFKFCIENNISTSSIMDEELKFFESIQKCETNNELQKRIVFITKGVIDKLAEREKINKLVKSAIDIIYSNYSSDITLDCIAKQVYITPGYLSQLFKQETGINFLDFLNQHRIQKAKGYLTSSFLKNYEISAKVGFNDEKYFSQVFKRYSGLTPTQYRDNCKK
jgi:two-component system, response regulator YesN